MTTPSDFKNTFVKLFDEQKAIEESEAFQEKKKQLDTKYGLYIYCIYER